jgi:enoyl-CoA hydratase/carnithine racemase
MSALRVLCRVLACHASRSSLADATEALAWQLSDEAAATVRASDDSREGVEAFLQKRAPRWNAR